MKQWTSSLRTLQRRISLCGLFLLISLVWFGLPSKRTDALSGLFCRTPACMPNIATSAGWERWVCFQKQALGPPSGFSERRTWFVLAATETANFRSLHLLVHTCTRALHDKLVTNTTKGGSRSADFSSSSHSLGSVFRPSGQLRYPACSAERRPVCRTARLQPLTRAVPTLLRMLERRCFSKSANRELTLECSVLRARRAL